MATRYYAFNPGNHLEDIIESVGAPNSSAVVELSIDLSTSKVTEFGTTRAILKSEVMIALDLFMQQIVRDTSGVLS
jgi:hypothetical protein